MSDYLGGGFGQWLGDNGGDAGWMMVYRRQVLVALLLRTQEGLAIRNSHAGSFLFQKKR